MLTSQQEILHWYVRGQSPGRCDKIEKAISIYKKTEKRFAIEQEPQIPHQVTH
jgi:hypothetical protein